MSEMDYKPYLWLDRPDQDTYSDPANMFSWGDGDGAVVTTEDWSEIVKRILSDE